MISSKIYALLLTLGLIGGSISAFAADSNVVKFVFHNNLDPAAKPGYPTKDKCPKYWDGNRCVCPAGSIMTSDGCVTSCTPGEDCPDEDKAVCYNDSDCQNCEHSCVNAKCVYEQKLYCDGDKVKYDKTSGPRPNCTPPLPVTAQDCAALGEGYTCSEKNGKAQCVKNGDVSCTVEDCTCTTYAEQHPEECAEAACPNGGELGSDGVTCCKNGTFLDESGEYLPYVADLTKASICGCPNGGALDSVLGAVCCKDSYMLVESTGEYTGFSHVCGSQTCPDGGELANNGATCCKDSFALDMFSQTYTSVSAVCGCPMGGELNSTGRTCCKDGKVFSAEKQDYTLYSASCGECPDGGELVQRSLPMPSSTISLDPICCKNGYQWDENLQSYSSESKECGALSCSEGQFLSNAGNTRECISCDNWLQSNLALSAILTECASCPGVDVIDNFCFKKCTGGERVCTSNCNHNLAAGCICTCVPDGYTGACNNSGCVVCSPDEGVATCSDGLSGSSSSSTACTCVKDDGNCEDVDYAAEHANICGCPLDGELGSDGSTCCKNGRSWTTQGYYGTLDTDKCGDDQSLYTLGSQGTHYALMTSGSVCPVGYHWVSSGEMINDFNCHVINGTYPHYRCTPFEFTGWLSDCFSNGVTPGSCQNDDYAIYASISTFGGRERSISSGATTAPAVCRRN